MRRAIAIICYMSSASPLMSHIPAKVGPRTGWVGPRTGWVGPRTGW